MNSPFSNDPLGRLALETILRVVDLSGGILDFSILPIFADWHVEGVKLDCSEQREVGG